MKKLNLFACIGFGICAVTFLVLGAWKLSISYVAMAFMAGVISVVAYTDYKRDTL
jgi:hypothetical protein